MSDRQKCAVLIPVDTHIETDTQLALQELERRGYGVFRTFGCSQIDMVRSQMASDFLAKGYEETMWIDSDVGFFPDDVDRIRRNNVPLCASLYPRKGQRSFATKLLPGTSELPFGKQGGLHEVRYAASGFLHARREVYSRMQEVLHLPTCNIPVGRGGGVVPYFLSLIVEEEGRYTYLSEDYSFCERARRAGFKVMVDTTIRLWHIGPYRFSWEEAAMGIPRYDQMTVHFNSDGNSVESAVIPEASMDSSGKAETIKTPQ